MFVWRSKVSPSFPLSRDKSRLWRGQGKGVKTLRERERERVRGCFLFLIYIQMGYARGPSELFRLSVPMLLSHFHHIIIPAFTVNGHWDDGHHLFMTRSFPLHKNHQSNFARSPSHTHKRPSKKERKALKYKNINPNTLVHHTDPSNDKGDLCSCKSRVEPVAKSDLECWTAWTMHWSNCSK